MYNINLYIVNKILYSGLVGLSITYALSVTSLLSGLINAFTETEREMIAVERIGEYINQIETEDDKSSETEEIAPPYGWPSMGIISFKDVVMKYRCVFLIVYCFCDINFGIFLLCTIIFKQATFASELKLCFVRDVSW